MSERRLDDGGAAGRAALPEEGGGREAIELGMPTMLLAYYASVVSSVLAVVKAVEWLKGRPNVQVDAQVRMEQLGGGGRRGANALSPVLRVYATSQGAKPLTITSVMIVTKYAQRHEERQTVRLEQGGQCSWSWRADSLDDIEGIYVSDSVGRRWIPEPAVLKEVCAELRRMKPAVDAPVRLEPPRQGDRRWAPWSPKKAPARRPSHAN